MQELLLFLHLLGVILWLGPSLGGWMMFQRAKRSDWEQQGFLGFEQVLRIEHFGFLLLIGTGVGLWASSSTLEMPDWLRIKLYVIGLLLIPFEIVDAYLVHFAARGDSANESVRQAQGWHERLFRYGSLPAAAAALWVLYLATARPGAS